MSTLGNFQTGELYGRELLSLTNYTESSADGGQESNVRFYGLYTRQSGNPGLLGSIGGQHRTNNGNNAGRLVFTVNDGIDNFVIAQTLSSVQSTFYVPINAPAGQSLELGINSTTYCTISSTGGVSIGGIDNATKFQITNAAAASIFTINTVDATIAIDGPVSTSKFSVGDQFIVDTSNLRLTLGTAGTSLYAPSLTASRLLMMSPTNFIETTTTLPDNISATNLMLTTPFMTVGQAGFVIASAGGALSSATILPFSPSLTGLTVSGTVLINGANAAAKFTVHNVSDSPIFTVNTAAAECVFNSAISMSGFTLNRILQLDNSGYLIASNTLISDVLIEGPNSATKFVIRNETPTTFFVVDSSTRRMTITGSQNSEFVGGVIENVDSTSAAATSTLRMRAAQTDAPHTTSDGNLSFSGAGFALDRDLTINALTNTTNSVITTSANKRLAAISYADLYPFAYARYLGTPNSTSTRAFIATPVITSGTTLEIDLTLWETTNMAIDGKQNNFVLYAKSDPTHFEVVTGKGVRYIGPTNPNIIYYISVYIALGAAGAGGGSSILSIGLNGTPKFESESEFPFGTNVATFFVATQLVTQLANNDEISLFIRALDGDRQARLTSITISVRGTPYNG